MQRAITIRRQQFFLLAITLSVLAIAILMLNHREAVQRELAMQIDNHRVGVYHAGRALRELRSLHQQLQFRQWKQRDATDNGDAMGLDDLFGNTVSIHVLREHVRDLLRRQPATASYRPLSVKLERQMEDFLAHADRPGPGETVELQRLSRQIEGFILSLEQIDGVHALDIRALSEQQARVSRRDGIALIFMTTMLVLVSYLSIAWIMGRIWTMVEEQDALTNKLEQQNAELERFTYTVSHDLKSPLVTIKNFIGMLERDVREDDRRKAFQDLEHISSAADDMASLLEGLLELGRVGHVINPPQAGRLNDVVERAIDQLRPAIEARDVELRVEPNMPEYWGDGLRLQEVFQNLIENSVKFMGEQPRPVIRVGAYVDQGELICEVGDNGIGIDPEFAERVFNLFERLDQEVEGTGIGLALVQRIIEAHGGRVRVKTDVHGPGCTVMFTLPLKPGYGRAER